MSDKHQLERDMLKRKEIITMNKTNIEWCDLTWNPIVGCSKVGKGCDNCYAEKMAYRHSCNPKAPKEYKKVVSDLTKWWNGKTALVESALKKKFSGKGKKIFVCSMGDLFHESVYQVMLFRVMQVIKDNPQHTFIALTKRPKRMHRFFTKHYDEFLPNLWLGVSVWDQDSADNFIPLLLKTPAAKRIVSVEPMLGEVDLKKAWPETAMNCMNCGQVSFVEFNTCPNCETEQYEGWGYIQNCPDDHKPFPNLDWVICGGESGPKARPLHPDWVTSLRDQCQESGVPFFFKQWGEWKKLRWQGVWTNKGDVFMDRDGNKGTIKRNGQMPASMAYGRQLMRRVGKNNAFCLIDGEEYKEYPREGKNNE